MKKPPNKRRFQFQVFSGWTWVIIRPYSVRPLSRCYFPQSLPSIHRALCLRFDCITLYPLLFLRLCCVATVASSLSFQSIGAVFLIFHPIQNTRKITPIYLIHALTRCTFNPLRRCSMYRCGVGRVCGGCSLYCQYVPLSQCFKHRSM